MNTDMAFHLCLVMLGVAAAGTNSSVPIPEEAYILGNDSYRNWLMFGAMGGGIAALVVFPATGPREIFMRFMVSALFGFFLTPLLFMWREWPPSPEPLAGGAFALSCMAWMIVKFLRDQNLEDVIGFFRGRGKGDKR